MSIHGIGSPPSTARIPRGLDRGTERPALDQAPIHTRSRTETADRRDAAGVFSRLGTKFGIGGFRSTSRNDDVFLPANASSTYAPPPNVHIGARVPAAVNGRAPTLEPHVRERQLLDLPETHRFIPPYEVWNLSFNGRNGRVFVSPLRAIDPRLPPGTLVTTAMDPEVRYF